MNAEEIKRFDLHYVLEGGIRYMPASEPTSESVQEFLTSLRDTHHIYDYKIQ